MKSSSQIVYCLVIAGILLPAPSFASLQEKIAVCAAIQQNPLRLNCYDELTQVKSVTQNIRFINPPSEFLASELRVERHVSEYQLSIADFVSLIKMAKMEDSRQIKILGWEKQPQSFTLHIKMRHRLSVSFQHVKTASENISILAPVMVNGSSVNAEIFIMNIASMTPDE